MPNSTPSQQQWASPIAAHTSLPRSLVLSILQIALAVGENRFARQAALAWLTAYPGDMQASLLHARAILQGLAPGYTKGHSQVLSILESLCQMDPEFLEAQELLILASKNAGLGVSADISGNVLALGGIPDPKSPAPEWAQLLRQSRRALARGNVEAAEQQVHQALLADPATPLAAVTHLQVEIQHDLPKPSIRSLAELYHERWPNCLQFILILAETLMDSGDSDQAVALLHQAVAQDVMGQVANRLWGKDHPYSSLWPDQLEAPLLEDLAIPAAVASVLGWNQLPSGEDGTTMGISATPEGSAQNTPDKGQNGRQTAVSAPSAPSLEKPLESKVAQRPANKHHVTKDFAIPESLLSVQAELERVAASLKQPQLARADGRFPVYVVLTTREGLEAQYGSQAAATLDKAMKRLVESVQARKNWGAILYYADKGYTHNGARQIEVNPVRPNDPWELKLALVDLDAVLGKRGEMIGAVLIVGGPEVIPFHLLPNPVDDADIEVPSDNPYSTRDENYFIPEWPVGRVPGGTGSDVEPLLHTLQEFTNRHKELSTRKSWYARLWAGLRKRFMTDAHRIRPSFGYTAAVWRQAALSVYSPIGEARSMLVSPPVQACNDYDEFSGEPIDRKRNKDKKERVIFLNVPLQPVRMGYFNLHGLQDAIEWYGQSDPTHTDGEPDYPVALRPQDIINSGHSPQVVFSEACYGANILGKTVEEALALKFLVSGSQAVVGSTCTSYGAIANPLAAADLLGFAFWNYLDEGYPAGEALRRAKIHVAREMHHRQGYLDGEDQKTLISFVLFGDPLAQPLGPGRRMKSIFRPLKRPAQVKTICDRTEEENVYRPIPPEVLTYVKHVVEQYLPGMNDAQLTFTTEHAECPGGGHLCPSAQMGKKARPSHSPERQVITLSKQVQQAASVHRHYARLTLDGQGKLVKLVVSR